MTAVPETTADPDKTPVYERKELPEHLQHLRTMTQLKEQRLKPADGQKPVALLRVYRRGHGWGEFPLYDPAGAAKMRPLSEKQQAAMTARRTCPECREVRGYVVYQRCEDCRRRVQQEALDRQARTCRWCRRGAGSALPRDSYGWRACEHCRVHRELRRQVEEEAAAVWRRTCPGRDCQVVTATDEEIAAERAARVWQGPRWCPPCKERDERERAERQQAEQEARVRAEQERRQEVRGIEAWAREVLADPDTVILDTETTGLHDEARIVDLGVLRVSGDVLVDTLLDPGEPIPAEATAIHGITDQDVAGAPSFGDVVEQLGAVLAGKRVLIYNRGYDVERLRYELTRYFLERVAEEDARKAVETGVIGEGTQARAVAEALNRATAWIDGMRFEDAMIPYSDWVGDWSDYWGNYSWQPLCGGDHRAVSDCRAVVERLREMAAGTSSERLTWKTARHEE